MQSLPYTYAQVTRGLFSGGKGSFTSFFTRTGYGGSPAGAPGGEASIHGGAMGGFRQVCRVGQAMRMHACVFVCVCVCFGRGPREPSFAEARTHTVMGDTWHKQQHPSSS